MTGVQFVLMLTEYDITISDALEVYQTIGDVGLRYVAVKDVGADRSMLEELSAAVHESGQLMLFEVADVSEAGQQAGVERALLVGADVIVGTWRPESGAAIASVPGAAYFPFLGSLSGSPLQLQGSPADLCAQSADLAQTPGVAGAVLMAYRQRGHSPDELMLSVVRASRLPVLIAGGVGSAEQVKAIGCAGAWGFTMGGEALKRRHEDRWSVRRKVIEVLSLCQSFSVTSAPYGTGVI